MKPTRFLRAAPLFRPDEYIQQARQAIARRPAKAIFDYLSPMPANQLNISLAGHVPTRCQPDHFSRRLKAYNSPSRQVAAPAPDGTPTAAIIGPDLRVPPPQAPPGQDHRDDDSRVMSPGHHLVYFPPQIPGYRLAPDGADADHCPGAPFVRRLWAGGSVTFAEGWEERLRLDGRRAVCVETVEPPVLSADKVRVDVVRRYGPVVVDEGASPARGLALDDRAVELVQKRPDIEEVRRLVFLGGEGATSEAPKRARKVVKAPFAAEENGFSMVPSAQLLFHFSALTFNAHAIHIDPLYAREREGHKGLLVHGPLSLTLMLALLQSHVAAMGGGWRLLSVDYKNVAPLYVDERMEVCMAPSPMDGDEGRKKWHVWVQGPDQGIAVKGTAVAVKAAFRKTDRP